MLTLCSSSSGEMVIWRSTLIFTESQSAFLASLSFCWLEHLEVLERRATVYHARGKDKTLRNEFQLPKHQVILLNVLAHLTNSTSCTGSTSAIKTSQVSLDTSSSYAHAQWSMPPYASYYQPSWSPSHIHLHLWCEQAILVCATGAVTNLTKSPNNLCIQHDEWRYFITNN